MALMPSSTHFMETKSKRKERGVEKVSEEKRRKC